MGNESISLVAKKLDVVRAANALCQEQKFDAITVSDICERADISSSTFYRLFNGKHDIPAWYLRFATHASIERVGADLNCEQAFRVILELMGQCRALYGNVKDTPEMNMVDRSENERLCGCILRNLSDYHDIEADKELRLELSWATVAGVALSGEWLCGRLQEDAGKLAHIFAECYPPRLKALLDAPPLKKPEPYANTEAVLALLTHSS